jgi:hypothetical protein
MHPSKENHPFKKLQHLVHGFSVRIDLFFEKEYFVPVIVFKVEKSHFVVNRHIQLS